MVIRLLFYILITTGAVALTGYGIRKALDPLLEERRVRRRAELNALHTCNECQDPVIPGDASTVFEYGRFHHRACLKRLLTT